MTEVSAGTTVSSQGLRAIAQGAVARYRYLSSVEVLCEVVLARLPRVARNADDDLLSRQVEHAIRNRVTLRAFDSI